MAISDSSGLPQGLIREAFEGLMNKDPEQSLADEVCRDMQVSEREGSVTLVPSTATIPRDYDGGRLPGSDPHLRSTSGTSVEYECLLYDGFRNLTDQDNQDFSGRGYQLLERDMKKSWDECHVKVDILLAAVLGDGSVNASFTANDAWNDATSPGNPFTDIREVTRTICPGPGLIAIGGRNVRDALAENPDFIAESSNFDAGALSDEEVGAQIETKINDIDKVYWFDKFYQEAPESEDLEDTRNRIFEDGFWIGYPDQLAKPEQRGDKLDSPALVSDRKDLAQTEAVGVVRTLDIVRGDEPKGVTFNGIIT